MFLYIIIVAIVALLTGILIAACTKKAEGVVYTKRDKAGRITNIVLIPVYAALSLPGMIFGFVCSPGYQSGILRLLGWIVAGIVPAAPLFCGLGLGLSVALRKKGKSKESFIIQFLGFVGIFLCLILFFVCYGNLLRYID